MNKQVITTTEQLTQFLSVFNNNCFSFDTETSYEYEREKMIADSKYTTSLSPKALKYTEQKISGLSMCDGKNACYIPLEPQSFSMNKYLKDEDTLQILKENIFNNKGRLLAHNIPFDATVIHKYGCVVNHKIFYDTMVAEHLLKDTSSKSLKKMATKYLGVKTDTFTEASENHYTERFFEYGMNDAIYTWEIARQQIPLLQEKDLMRLFKKVEMPFQKVLIEMRLSGVKVDTEKLKAQTSQAQKQVVEFTKELHSLTNRDYSWQKTIEGEQFLITKYNFNSPELLRKILFTEQELTVVETTKTGLDAVGKFTLQKYKSNPVVSKLLKYKGCSKLLSSFLTPMPSHIESDGRIRANLRDTGARTGRLSCTDPNLQQLSDIEKVEYKDINLREVFIPSEGKIMLAIDYSAQEMRVAAQVSMEPNIINSILKGKDLHLTTANGQANLGIPEEELYDTHPNYETHKEKYGKERGDAKIVNFGILYGKGAYGFAKDLDVTEDEGQSIVDSYYNTNTMVKKATDECSSFVDKHGYIRSLAGRYRYFDKEGLYYNKKVYRQAFNFLIQGASADITRVGCIKVYQYFKKRPEYGVTCLLTVHDELLLECNIDRVDEVQRISEELFKNAVTNKFVVPLTSHGKSGYSYASAK